MLFSAVPQPLARLRDWLANALGLRSRILTDSCIQDLRGRTIVLLSPHFDDACFSLGCLLQSLSTGHLVNIFTQGTYVATARARPDAADQQVNFSIRDAEDAAFAAQCRMVRHDLGCEEPSLRGRRPSELFGLPDDRGQIHKPIRDCLTKIARTFPSQQRGFLLAPMGVGRHVNHRAVASVIAEILPDIAHLYDVHFYEDMPYAGSFWQRLRALHRMKRRVPLHTRFVYPVHRSSKRDLIALYPSQLKPGALGSMLKPSAPFPAMAHEAFWSVEGA